MNIYDVGLENLPNVYVDKIRLTTDNGIDYRITIGLSMFDHERRSWKNRPEMIDLKVKYVLVHDYNNTRYSEITTALNSGLIGLEQFVATTDKYQVLETVPPANIGGVMDGFTRFYHLGGGFSFRDLPMAETNNITVYTATFLDNINFANPSLNVFYGPMTSEVILRNGLTNTVSGYFYFPDTNEEYSGPVHSHLGAFMEGSRHIEEPHRQLRYVQIENNKIDSDFE